MTQDIKAQLETDGIWGIMYHLLWKKDDSLPDDGLRINLPDTIIYTNKQPVYWYYSNTDGVICKRKKTSMLLQNIINKFCENPSKSEIVCSFAYNDIKEPGKIVFKYFNKKGFRNLHNRFLSFL